MSTRSSSNFEDVLNCGICLVKKTHPKYLDCHHSFCADCLENCRDQDRIKCPTCRRYTSIPEGISGLVNNLDHQDYVDFCRSISITSLDTADDDTPVSGDVSFQIFVRDIDGKTRTINEVRKTDSVDDLKNKVREKTGIPIHEQRLIFGGKQLESGKLLSEYRIGRDANLHLILRLKGGTKNLHTASSE